MKFNFKKITVIATIFILTVVLTNIPILNISLAYANKQEFTSVNSKLSNLQNIYFELCRAKEEKKVISKNDIKEIVGKLPITKTSKTKWAKCDIYNNANENLKIGYSNDKKEKIEYISYGVDNCKTNIDSIKLHYLDIKDYQNKLGLVL